MYLYIYIYIRRFVDSWTYMRVLDLYYPTNGPCPFTFPGGITIQLSMMPVALQLVISMITR